MAEDDERKDSIWQRAFPPVLVAAWLFVPELRRLVDWQIGYNSLPIINLVPLVALLPLLGTFLDWKRVPYRHDFRAVVGLWLTGFGYALLVAFLSGGLFGALYEGALFLLPLLMGLWVASLGRAGAVRAFDRFSSAMLWLSALAAAYGVFQFIAPPPWDVAWVTNSGLGSIGSPVPFGLRIFGPLNSPGVFGDVLTVALLLNVHRLGGGRRAWLIVPVLIIMLALALTFNRTAWLALVLGGFVYLWMSPRRAPVIAAAAISVVLTLSFGANLSLLTGDPTSNSQLQSRLSTFKDVQSDDSAVTRADETTVALREAISEPLGQGLGTLGTATKLSGGATTVLDNGYLMRFVEMGAFGFLAFLLALFVAIAVSFVRLREARAASDASGVAVLATSLAVQVALAGAEISGDHHSAFMAIVFWLLIGASATLPLSGRQPALLRVASAGRGL